MKFGASRTETHEREAKFYALVKIPLFLKSFETASIPKKHFLRYYMPKPEESLPK